MTFRLTKLSSSQEMCHLMVEAFWSYVSGNQKVSHTYRKQYSAALDKSWEPRWLVWALPLSLRLSFLICQMGVISHTYLTWLLWGSNHIIVQDPTCDQDFTVFQLFMPPIFNLTLSTTLKNILILILQKKKLKL